MPFDIAAIITARREGEAVRASLRSFENAVLSARIAGLRVQTIHLLDDADDATLAVFDPHRCDDTIRIASRFTNPALAKNAAIDAVDASYVAVLDAPDLWTFDWLTTAHAYLRDAPAKVIAHPQFSFRFGADRQIVRHPDQESFDFDIDLLRLIDLWGGSGVCPAAICRTVPFRADSLMAADWTWNMDALSAGYVHKVIAQTAIFSGRSEQGLLPAETPLSRYDSALYAAFPSSRTLTIPDGFLDALSNIDVTYLHLIFLGRQPDDLSRTDAFRREGLATFAGSLIRSAEFAARLDRMLSNPEESTIADEVTALALKDWAFRRFGLSLSASRPEQIGHAALAGMLFAFPFRLHFEERYGTRAHNLVEQLKRKATDADDRWRGYIDHCSGDFIRGWIVCADRPGLLTIAIKVDGILAGVCEASIYRRDVANMLGENAICGFEVVPVIDWNLILERDALVTFHDVETGEVLPFTATLANQRRSDARSLSGTLLEMAEDAPTSATVRVECYDSLLSHLGIPVPPSQDHAAHSCPTVSVVLFADEGTATDLDETLQSLALQSHAAIQVLIVQNCDEDHSARFANGRISVSALPPGADAHETCERILAAADGDLLYFVAPASRLHRDAVSWFAYVFQRFGAGVIYADDIFDRYAPGGARHVWPDLKPGFDRDLLLQYDYMSALFCIAKPHLAAALAASRLDAVTRYERLLQFLQHVPDDQVFHVPLVLHRRKSAAETGPSTTAQRQTVERHMRRSGTGALVRDTSDSARPGWTQGWYPCWPPAAPRGRMAIIIPTRDRVELLKPCIDSLWNTMADPGACEVLIVDNGSQEAATLEYFDSLQVRTGVRIIRADGEFNWSALNNLAARHTDAEFLLFANNDIEVFTKGFDDILRGLLERADVGAVGALLIYPNGTIQHAGTALGIGGVADHICAGRMPADAGIARIARYQRSVGAVTGAFLGVCRSTFEQLGGYDDVNLKIAFSDVDFCLKVGAAGLRVLYTPQVTCLHHESASRGLDALDPAKAARANAEILVLQDRWGAALTTDPAYNIAYDRNAEPFTMAGVPTLLGVLGDLERQSAKLGFEEAR